MHSEAPIRDFGAEMKMPDAIIRSYAQALKNNDYQTIIDLFSKDARIFSFLAGEQPAPTFFKSLFENSSRSEVEVKNIFFDIRNRRIAAAYLHIKAVWSEKYPIEFEAVDIFELDSEDKIKNMKIVLDSYPIRVLRERSLQQ